MIKSPSKLLALMFCVCMLGFSYAALADEDQPITISDPNEKFNRDMFRFNDFLDRFILKPVAKLYLKIVPKPIVRGVTNIYANIDTIPTVFNDILQGNFYQATNDAWRFTLNSTVGILGFFDPAAKIGLAPNKEDFGLTLAKWGYTKSNYLVLPFFGPSSFRDAIGLPVDYYAFTVYPHISSLKTRYKLYGGGVVSSRADLLRFEKVFDQTAMDKYVFLRDAYIQRRTFLIERNNALGNPNLHQDASNTNQLGASS